MKTLILNPTAIASVILLSSLFHVEPILGDGCPAPAFVSPRTFETRGGSSSLAVGDFNGDGQPDLAVANFDSDDVSILLGKGDGDFQSAVTYRTGVHPVFVAVGDLNGDAQPDLVVANEGDGSSGDVSVLLGKGDGTFLAAVNYGAGLNPHSVTVGDFNSDGNFDLAVANETSANVSVLLGRGDGTFQPAVNYCAGSNPESAVVADFNGDGRPDLVVANAGSFVAYMPRTGGSLSVLLGNGDGTFQAAVNYAVRTYPQSVAVGDFNGDGKPDLAVANRDPESIYTGGSVSVLLGKGDGNFQPAVIYDAGPGPRSAKVSDFNNDGKLDLVIANADGVAVLLGKGDGTFKSRVNYAAGLQPSSVAVGDFNNDGRPDLAVANDFQIAVLLGNVDGTFPNAIPFGVGAFPHSVAAGDFNGDGRPDLAVANGSGTAVLLGQSDGTFQRAVNYAAGANPVSVLPADLNSDGRTDLAVANKDGIAVLLGQGDGTFRRAVNYAAGTNPVSVVMADFNGDGKPDLAVANAGSPGSFPDILGGAVIPPNYGSLSVLLGQGEGTFQSPSNYSVGNFPRSVAVGDFNGDGKPDLAVINSAWFGGPSTLVVLLGRGDGTFQSPVNTAAGTSQVVVVAADVNGDAKSDLVVVSETPAGSVSVLLSKGDGTFQSAVNSTTGANPVSVAVGDFNVDGKPDLAVANLSSGDVSVLLGKGDGSFQTAANWFVGYGPGSVAVGDFNGDDLPDIVVARAAGLTMLPNTCAAVNSTNTVPVARSQTRSVMQGTLTAITLVALAADRGILTYNVTSPTHGTLSGTPPNVFYRPAPDYVGPDSFTFTASAGNADSAIATVSIIVIATNHTPVAQSQMLSVTQDMAAAITLSAFDADHDELTYVVSQPAHGTLSGTPPNVLYQPALHYYGSDAFAFAVNDGKTDSARATVSLKVLAADHTPVTDRCPAPNFVAIRQIDLITGLHSIAVDDFNGDGVPDLAAANDGPAPGHTVGRVWILLGRGDGTFRFLVEYGVGNDPRSVAVGDFNGDGKPDLAVANSGSDRVSVLLGKGDGTFQPAVNYGAGADPWSVVAGDFNHDGKADLAVANINSRNVSVLLGKGDGTFESAVNYRTGIGPRSVATGDFNGDGKPDLVAANSDSGNVSVLLGKGDGTFQPAVNYGAAAYPFSVAVGDFNSDGKPDLVVAGSTVAVLLGNGDGTFRAGANYGTGPAPYSIMVGDFNGDGKADLAVANNSSSDISVLAGKGDGTFQAAVNYSAGFNPVSVAVGDFNGDGKADLAVANDTSGTISVLLNCCVSDNFVPIAQSQMLSVTEDTTAAITLSAFDAADHGSLTYTVNSPAHGTLSGTPLNLVYRPALHYFGPDSFTFKVNDGEADSAPATVSITVVRVNHAPIADASATVTRVISPNNHRARVVLDGSRSHDAENDPLQYSWFTDDLPTASATGRVVVVTLSVGTHDVWLRVDDVRATGTNRIAIRVITAADAADELIRHVQAANLRRPHSLLSQLSVARRAFDAGNFDLGARHLQLFQKELRELSQKDKVDADTAAALLCEAQAVISALNETGNAQVRFTACKCQKDGHVRLQFSGATRRTYLIEASIDFNTWLPVGVGSERGEGEFEFEEAGSPLPCRFYRIIAP